MENKQKESFQVNGPVFRDELLILISEELKHILKDCFPTVRDWPQVRKGSKSDYVLILGPLCGSLKMRPEEFGKKSTEHFNEYSVKIKI